MKISLNANLNTKKQYKKKREKKKKKRKFDMLNIYMEGEKQGRLYNSI